MDMKSKLKSMPNFNKEIANSKSTTCWLIQIAALNLYLLILLISIVYCVDSSPYPVASRSLINETTTPKFDRDVKDLKLMADFRAVKLRWSYEHGEANEPVSFDIRLPFFYPAICEKSATKLERVLLSYQKYCELTSWDIEIKCRHRDLKVAPNANSRAVSKGTQQTEKNDEKLTTVNASNENEKSPVIPVKRLYPTEVVHQLENNSNQYEVQIFDLRALTNYTFQVRVSRFLHEPELVASNQTKDSQQGLPHTERRFRAQAARRMNVASHEQLEHPRTRIETKPFGAEATKCLADVSEVLINTGRYFGGRISVEDSSDPRCNLIGNKSSEQTSYLFRIDHQICDSKIVDGNRIETMVLVHENKDILTHNTARFLVLCNFLQKSFTLRASISLPKVNGVVAHSRPAKITSLPQKPFDNNNNNVTEDHSMSVLLGSMPGIYRARTAQSTALSQQQQQQQQGNNSTSNISNNNKAYSYSIPTLDELQLMQQVNQDVNRSSPAQNSINLHQNVVDELETNTIEKFIDKKSSRSSGQHQQQQSVTIAKSSSATSGNINNGLIVEQRQSKQLGSASHNASGEGGNSNSSSDIDSLLPMATMSKRTSTINKGIVENSREKARSLTLSSLDANINNMPQPVQVQSKLLFVERSNPASRVGRQQAQAAQQKYLGKPVTTLQSNLVERSTSSSQFDTLDPATFAMLAPTTVPPTSSQTVAATTTTTLPPSVTDKRDKEKGDALFSASKNLKQWQKNEPAPATGVHLQLRIHSQQSPSIIMTNNHRIAGDYLPLAQATPSNLGTPSSRSTASNTNDDNNFSIKYSAAKVDEYPVGQSDADIPFLEPVGNSSSSKDRGSQMRGAEDEPYSLMGLNSQVKSRQSKTGSSWTVDNRMGEVMGAAQDRSRNKNNQVSNLPAEPQQVDLISETSNEFSSDLRPAGISAVNGTLAQNITSLLLNWSLKTLTNLARKSFESFASQNGSEQASYLNNSDLASGNEQNDYEQRNEPTQIDRLRVNHSSEPPVLESLLKNPASQKVFTPNDRNAVAAANRTITVAPVATTGQANLLLLESKKEITTSTTSTVKPALILNNPEVSDKLLDDFMTGTNRVDEVPRISTIPPQAAEISDNNRLPKQHIHSRPSNYSKSLDFARIAGNGSETAPPSSHRLKISEKNNIGKTNATNATRQRNQHQHHHNQQHQSSIGGQQDQPIQSNRESAWTNHDSFYSSWMFYGLLLFIAIITGTFLTLWLVTVPLCENKVKSSGRQNNEHNESYQHNHYSDPQTFLQSQQQILNNNNTTTPRATLKINHPISVVDNSLNSPRSRSLLDISYQKYDYNKFDNYHNDVTINNNNSSSASIHVGSDGISDNGNNGEIINNDNVLSTVGKGRNKANCIRDNINNNHQDTRFTARELISGRLDQQSPSSASQRTRSTSAGSTMMVDENDCKNNEFLYTEHVLINTGISFGESYA